VIADGVFRVSAVFPESPKTVRPAQTLLIPVIIAAMKKMQARNANVLWHFIVDILLLT